MCKLRGHAVSLVLAGMLFSWGHVARSKTPERRSELPAHAQTRDRVLPLAAKGTRRITIDGDLTDWDGVTVGRGFMQQEIDHLAATLFPNAHDAATIRLLCSDDALYVAVHVVDTAIENPFEDVSLCKGDCIELFLDVRPIASATEPILGDQKYSAGVCHIFLVPPTAKSAAPRWLDTNDKESVIGSFDFASLRLSDGYTAELRIPYSSLKGASAARLREPIGFDMLIDDKDTSDPQGKFSVYSWGGLAGAFYDASRFGISEPHPRAAKLSPYLRIETAKNLENNGKLTMQATVVTPRNAGELKQSIGLTAKFEASAFDRTPPAAKAVAGKELPQQPKIVPAKPQIIDYPQLGMALRQETLQMEELAPGRYTFQTHIAKLKGADKVARFYGLTYAGKIYLGEVAPPTVSTNLLDALSSTFMSLQLNDGFPSTGEKTTGSVLLDFEAAPSWQLSQWAAGELKRGTNRFYSLEITTSDEHGKVVGRQATPLRHFASSVPFLVNPLPTGKYTLRASIIAPTGQIRAVSYQQPYGKKVLTREATASLRVMPPRDIVLKSTVADAPHLLRHAAEIGSPNRERFPKDDWRDCYARSVRDLHVYEGRIYIGCGDWNNNRGPIDIWSFAPVGAAAVSGQASFRKEFTVDDESVDIIRDYGGRLYVPGIDARESWDLGNLYVKEAGKWTKHRSIPNGIHVFDAAEYDGKLYVTTGTETDAHLYESADGGNSWRLAAEDIDQYRFGRLVPLRDALLVMPYDADQKPFLYSNGKPQWLPIPLFPHFPAQSQQEIEKLSAFNGGAIYASDSELLPLGDRIPLLFLQDFDRGAMVVEQFQRDQVRDIKVEGGVCYVLTGKPVGTSITEFTAEIYSSRDLHSWTRLAATTLPALPKSLAVLSGQFYIGLALNWSWTEPNAQQIANPASGSIWVLDGS